MAKDALHQIADQEIGEADSTGAVRAPVEDNKGSSSSHPASTSVLSIPSIDQTDPARPSPLGARSSSLAKLTTVGKCSLDTAKSRRFGTTAGAEWEELTMEERNHTTTSALTWLPGALFLPSSRKKRGARMKKKKIAAIKGYRARIESELSNICGGILVFLW
ncbi:14-3-3-like protein [Nymphaea thermarum]|nr:14-3-3-like protein [Nymphaea thermarum]